MIFGPRVPAVEGEELSKEIQALGFPVEHKHKLCCLRQELIDSFVESRYMMFIKYAAFHLQQLGVKKQKDRAAAANAAKAKELPQIAEKEHKEDTAEKAAEKVDADADEGKKEAETEVPEKEMEADEAKKIVESITDSFANGEKNDCKLLARFNKQG